jgi:hypothetical protein
MQLIPKVIEKWISSRTDVQNVRHRATGSVEDLIFWILTTGSVEPI